MDSENVVILAQYRLNWAKENLEEAEVFLTLINISESIFYREKSDYVNFYILSLAIYKLMM